MEFLGLACSGIFGATVVPPELFPSAARIAHQSQSFGKRDNHFNLTFATPVAGEHRIFQFAHAIVLRFLGRGELGAVFLTVRQQRWLTLFRHTRYQRIHIARGRVVFH